LPDTPKGLTWQKWVESTSTGAHQDRNALVGAGMIAALRYYDTFVKVDGAWLFAERLLYVDWIEERPLA
jgi:hypothetical protein